MKRVAILLLVVSIFYQCKKDDPKPSGLNVSTFAGKAGVSGNVDGTGSEARFKIPYGIDIDDAGNIYVADRDNFKVRRITPGGVVTTVAGTTIGYEDGPVATAKLFNPFDVAVDKLGNVYVVERDRIRKVTPDGNVSTFAAISVYCIDTDESNNVYVGDESAVRKITPAKEMSILAGGQKGFGDGPGIIAKFDRIRGITLDKQGNVYVTDTDNTRIRKITPAGEVTTVAGSHPGHIDDISVKSRFNAPIGIAVDAVGNIFVTDSYSPGDALLYTIRKVGDNGMVTTLSQTDWDGDPEKTFFSCSDIAMASDGTIYIADLGAHCIRKARQ